MRLTTRGRYAVTAMLDLVSRQGSAPVKLGDIACRQNIPVTYLEQLFSCLRREELIIAERGRRGGYLLAPGKENITIAEIVDAVDENVDATLCSGRADCHGGETCLTHYLWQDLGDEIKRFLSNIRLNELLSRHDIAKVLRRQRQSHAQHEQTISTATIQ